MLDPDHATRHAIGLGLGEMMARTMQRRIGRIARDRIADVAACLRFFSRLPVRSGDPPPARRFGQIVAMLPVAGLLIGACGALPLAVAAALGLPPTMAAIVATAAGLLATGGLHEDGLADTADGLGGGTSRDRKLAIMRDSRIGTYGVLALTTALLWRVAALGAILDRDGLFAAVLVLLAAAAMSRACALLPLALLPPARDDGLGRGVGALDRGALAICFGLATILGVALPLLGGIGLVHAALAVVLAWLGAGGVTRLARSQIGGQTGDIAGACQQAGEAGYWLGLLVMPSIV